MKTTQELKEAIQQRGSSSSPTLVALRAGDSQTSRLISPPLAAGAATGTATGAMGRHWQDAKPEIFAKFFQSQTAESSHHHHQQQQSRGSAAAANNNNTGPKFLPPAPLAVSSSVDESVAEILSRLPALDGKCGVAITDDVAYTEDGDEESHPARPLVNVFFFSFHIQTVTSIIY